LYALDSAAGVLRDGNDLEAERQHVRRQRASTIVFRIDVVLAEMREAAVEKNR